MQDVKTAMTTMNTRKLTFATLAALALTGGQGAFCHDYVEQTEFPSYYQQDSSALETYVPYSDHEIEQEALMAAAAQGQVDEKNALMTSTSYVNWTKGDFSSDVLLDVEKAGIPLPSGKSTSVKQIEMKLPNLVKNPLLSLYVDDSKTLGDLVLEGTVTLESLTRIIDQSKRTPAVFVPGGKLLTKHTIMLSDIASALVKHKKPYEKMRPVDRISSREYTGIVIDARGELPIHGEFVKSEVYPCLFPKIWTEDMELLYEKNMTDPDAASKNGIVGYSSSPLIEDWQDRAGSTPLWITAKKVFGINRCDPVISYDDYLRIASVPANLELLKQGKVVILLEKDNLEHQVQVAKKDQNFYISYHQLKKYFFERKVPDVGVTETLQGIQITMQNLRFIADSAELLPGEKPRIAEIAQSLKQVAASGEYSILIEGHTADVNKPTGQMTLSIQRAKSIIGELVANGIDESLFTYRGYGGTKPVADNSTPEGRALNRRVEIIVMPRGSYILSE